MSTDIADMYYVSTFCSECEQSPMQSIHDTDNRSN